MYSDIDQVKQSLHSSSMSMCCSGNADLILLFNADTQSINNNNAKCVRSRCARHSLFEFPQIPFQSSSLSFPTMRYKLKAITAFMKTNERSLYKHWMTFERRKTCKISYMRTMRMQYKHTRCSIQRKIISKLGNFKRSKADVEKVSRL